MKKVTQIIIGVAISAIVLVFIFFINQILYLQDPEIRHLVPASMSSAIVDTSRHPYLLFSEGDIGGMRSDISNSSSKRKAMYEDLKYLVDQGGVNANNLAASAILSTLDSSYQNRVISAMENINNWGQDWGGTNDLNKGEYIFNFALAYDVMYNSLTSTQRTNFKNTLSRELNILNDLTVASWTDQTNWWKNAYIQNHLHQDLAALGIGSLAIINEDGDAQSWLNAAKDKFNRAVYLMDATEGGWHESPGYQNFMMQRFPSFFYALRRYDGTDYLNNNGLKKYPTFALYNALPNNYNYFLPFSDYNGHWTLNPIDVMRLMAREEKNGYAQWLADRYISDYGGRNKIWGSKVSQDETWNELKIALELVFYDSSVNPTPPANLPLAYDENDLGLSILKSDWSENGIEVALKSGNYGGKFAFNQAKTLWCWNPDDCGGTTYPYNPPPSSAAYPQDHGFNVDHNHPDNNGLYVFGNGQWLLPEAAGYGLDSGHDSPWGKLTESHNTILVDGRGQIGEGRESDSLGTETYQNDYKDFWKQSSTITEKSHTPNYDYVSGDAGSAYPGWLELTKFSRNVLFVKSNYAVVFDDLRANAQKTYDWRGHALDSVTQEGNWIKAAAKNNQLLGIYVLSPNSFSFSSGCQTCEMSDTNLRFLDPDLQINYFNISAEGSEKRFITFLYPTNNGDWSLKPTIASLGEDSQKAGVKVQSADNSKDYLMVTYGSAGEVTLGGGSETFSHNGKAAAIRKDGNGVLKSLFLSRGTSLKEGGNSLITTSNSNSVFEAIYSGNNVAVNGENINDFTLYAPGVATLYVNGASRNFSRNGDFITYPTTEPQPFSLAISSVSIPESAERNKGFKISVTITASGNKEDNYRGVFVRATDDISGICQRISGTAQTDCSSLNSEEFWNGTKTYTLDFPGLVNDGSHILTIEAAVDTILAQDITKDTKTASIRITATPPPQNQGPINLLSNPNFENNNTAPWSKGSWQANISVSTDPRNGVYAGKVAYAGGPFNAYSIDNWPGEVPNPQAGDKYFASVWVKGIGSSVGKKVQLVVREHDDAGRDAETGMSAVALNGNWQQLAVMHTIVNEGMTNLDVFVTQDGAVAGDAFLADEMFAGKIVASEPHPQSGVYDGSVITSLDDATDKYGTILMIKDSPLNTKIENDGRMISSGLRFRQVNIPQGATITSAYIKLNIVNATYSNIDINIYGEASGNAAEFSRSYVYISKRQKTSSSAGWTQLKAGIGTKQSPELKSIIQEIVNRSDWTSNNSLAILLFGRSSRLGSFCAYDNTVGTSQYAAACLNNSARLHIEYVYTPQ